MRRWIALAGGVAALALTGTALAVVGNGWAEDSGKTAEPAPTIGFSAENVAKPATTLPTAKDLSAPDGSTTTKPKPDPTSPTKEPEKPEKPKSGEPLDLEVLHPKDGDVFSEKMVTFRGTTTPGSKVFAGKWEAEVDADGSWRIVLVLSEGANRAKFTASDGAGNETVASVTVYYKPTKSTTTTKPKSDKPPKVDFSANAKFGSSIQDPAYDLYFGTGKPGTHIYVISEFGSAKTQVNEKGKWQIKVFFEGAPTGKPFQVKVKDDFGNFEIFEFAKTD